MFSAVRRGTARFSRLAACSSKSEARRITSSRRSRSGGVWIGNTLNRDAMAAKHFLRWALARAVEIRPRVINVDGHPAYPQLIADLKRAGEMGRNCRCRPAPYLNNIIEQDHRFIKKRITASLWFRSVDGALNTIAGYEAMPMIRKGQIRWLPKGHTVGQV